MPEGTPLEATAGVASALADEALRDAAVTSVQSYTGTASPYTFNGLVRHYFLRRGAEPRRSAGDARAERMTAATRAIRSPGGCGHDSIQSPSRLGARIQVVEVPPGPPVLQTLVAEVYGPDPARRLELARTVRGVFEQTAGVVDVDWYVESSALEVAAGSRWREGSGGRTVRDADRLGRPAGRRRRACGAAARSAGARGRADCPASAAGRSAGRSTRCARSGCRDGSRSRSAS